METVTVPLFNNDGEEMGVLLRVRQELTTQSQGRNPRLPVLDPVMVWACRSLRLSFPETKSVLLMSPLPPSL